MHSWIDGQPATAVNLQNRGLAYGDGLFETIAVHGGKPSLLDGHLHAWHWAASAWRSTLTWRWCATNCCLRQPAG
jgi:branched-subunit amino acid aminotransferase/4-amino-4-deoxychorismate lyase